MNEVEENLRRLDLRGRLNLHNVEAIKYCTQLQELNLSVTNINDNQLVEILNQIGVNLKTLGLQWCDNLHNVVKQ